MYKTNSKEKRKKKVRITEYFICIGFDPEEIHNLVLMFRIFREKHVAAAYNNHPTGGRVGVIRLLLLHIGGAEGGLPPPYNSGWRGREGLGLSRARASE